MLGKDPHQVGIAELQKVTAQRVLDMAIDPLLQLGKEIAEQHAARHGKDKVQSGVQVELWAGVRYQYECRAEQQQSRGVVEEAFALEHDLRGVGDGAGAQDGGGGSGVWRGDDGAQRGSGCQVDAKE